jgi:adenosylcobinamide-phosphate synthase
MSVIAAAIALALALDLLVAEPPQSVHPVAWFGRVVGRVDRDWAHPLLVGAFAAVGLPLVAAAVGWGVVRAAATAGPLAATIALGLVVFVTTSFRLLLERSREVISAAAEDLETARTDLAALAGRDASGLSPGLVRSAAIESLAENLIDGLVATLLAAIAFGLVSPPLAAAGAVWVKAVNTMDSMLGYPSKTVGTPVARLDDVVMWLPARVGAVLLAVGGRAPAALRTTRRWLDGVPSPNSGWPMGVLAAVLDVRLEKSGVYTLNPTASLPGSRAGERGLRVVAITGVLTYGVAIAAAVGVIR